ncbi:MAG TPA: hypothetical protein VG889_08820 [Rhizomicrobium sp.]|nr:hypothetical protein [Rhizomicrobium sp.]
MRTLIIATALFVATQASADTWTGAYGNTIESTYGDGRVVKVYVEADHSYSILLPNGATLKGTWADAGGQSCFTVTDPPQKPGATPTCFPVKEYKIGDTFSGDDATGHFNGAIKAGR